MEHFIHRQNLIWLRKQLAEAMDDARRRQIVKLLADEELKDHPQTKEKLVASVNICN
jgi:hypothetical protein